LTVPSGTWYDYLHGATAVTSSTLMLAPGELLVLTGSPLAAPAVPDSYEEFSVDIPFTPAAKSASAQKVLENGHIYIIKDNVWYNVQGTRIK